MQYTNDNNTLLVTKTLYHPDGSTYDTSTSYSIEILTNQIGSITKQRDEMIAVKQSELDEVNLLLSKCDELGIKQISNEYESEIKK